MSMEWVPLCVYYLWNMYPKRINKIDKIRKISQLWLSTAFYWSNKWNIVRCNKILSRGMYSFNRWTRTRTGGFLTIEINRLASTQHYRSCTSRLNTITVWESWNHNSVNFTRNQSSVRLHAQLIPWNITWRDPSLRKRAEVATNVRP